MMNKLAFVFLISLALATVTCGYSLGNLGFFKDVANFANEGEAQIEAQKECLPVYELTKISEDFELLRTAMEQSGFYDLAQKTFAGTVFAPTDNAIRVWLKQHGKSFDEFMTDKDFIINVLNMHFVPGQQWMSKDLKNEQVLSTLDEGKQLTIYLEGNQIKVQSPASSAKVLARDLFACDTVIHVIDTILFPAKPQNEGESEQECKTLMQILEESGNFDFMEVAMKVTGIKYETGEFAGTMFVPNDDAFAQIIEDSGYDLGWYIEHPEALKQILRLHFVPGQTLPSEQLQDGQSLSTLDEQSKLNIALTEDGVSIKAPGSQATVIQPDIRSCKAVLHTIDHVLMPVRKSNGEECKTIYEILSENSDFDVLQKALEVSELKVKPEEFSGTFFAPTDEAFSQALQEIGIDVAQLIESVSKLDETLKLHLIPGEPKRSEDLENGQTLTTLAGDKDLKVSISGDTMSVSTGTNEAKVEKADIVTCNAVIHVIDHVLIA